MGGRAEPSKLVARVQQCDRQALEVAHVACHQAELVCLGRGGYEHVGLRAEHAARHQVPAQLSGPGGDLQADRYTPSAQARTPASGRGRASALMTLVSTRGLESTGKGIVVVTACADLLGAALVCAQLA